MSSTDRVFRILESELNKNLSFTYTIEQAHDPGSRRVIRAGQQFTVTVRVRNDSSLTMTEVRGVIRPTSHATFERTSFSIDRLRGGTTEQVARLRMTIEQAPAQGYVFDELLGVTITARADLSRFRFQDSNRQVRYAQLASSPDGARPPLRTVRVTVPDRPRPSTASAGDRSPGPRRGSRFLGLRSAFSRS